MRNPAIVDPGGIPLVLDAKFLVISADDLRA